MIYILCRQHMMDDTFLTCFGFGKGDMVKGICSTMLDLHNDNCDICVTVVDYAADRKSVV